MHHTIAFLLLCCSWPSTYVMSQTQDSPCPNKNICQRCDYDFGTLILECPHFEEIPDLNAFFSRFSNIRQLKIINSGLNVVPQSICQLKALQYLDVSQNNLNEHSFNITCLPNLRTLIADHNLIDRLSKNTFEWFGGLSQIFLRHNKISFLDPEAFLSMYQLFNIELSHNRLEVADCWFFKLNQVKMKNQVYYNVSFNHIYKMTNDLNVTLDEFPLDNPRISVLLDARYNKMEYLKNFDFVKLLKVHGIKTMVKLINCGFLLDFNPWKCDCYAFEIVDQFKVFLDILTTFNDAQFLTMTCSTDGESKAFSVFERYKNSKEDFKCFQKESCPDGFLCEKRPGIKTIKISANTSDITQLPTVIPMAQNTELRLNSSTIKKLEYRSYLINVTTLDFSHSDLEVIEDKALKALTKASYLYFDNCKFKKPPNFQGMVEVKWKEIRFENNPFECDCNTLQFKSFLSKHRHIVKNIKDIQCRNGEAIIDAPLSAFVCRVKQDYDPKYIYIIGVSVALAFAMSAIIVYARWRKVQMQYLRSFHKKLSFGSKTMSKKCINNDVSFHYHDKDDAFFESDILPGIESWYRCSYPKKDVHPGRREFAGANDLMEHSRCSVIILSKGSLSDPRWGMIFQMALDTFIKYKDKKLILILRDSVSDILATHGIDKDIGCFLQVQCITYIHVPELTSTQLKENLMSSLKLQLGKSITANPEYGDHELGRV